MRSKDSLAIIANKPLGNGTLIISNRNAVPFEYNHFRTRLIISRRYTVVEKINMADIYFPAAPLALPLHSAWGGGFFFFSAQLPTLWLILPTPFPKRPRRATRPAWYQSKPESCPHKELHQYSYATSLSLDDLILKA